MVIYGITLESIEFLIYFYRSDAFLDILKMILNPPHFQYYKC